MNYKTYLANFIRVLGDFDVYHQQLPEDNLAGMVALTDGKIYIDTNQTTSRRRHTVIHELIHALHYYECITKGFKCDLREERLTKQEANELYIALFGGDTDGIQADKKTSGRKKNIKRTRKRM